MVVPAVQRNFRFPKLKPKMIKSRNPEVGKWKVNMGKAVDRKIGSKSTFNHLIQESKYQFKQSVNKVTKVTTKRG